MSNTVHFVDQLVIHLLVCALIPHLRECYIRSKWLSSKPVTAVHAAVMLQTKTSLFPLAGLKHSCMSLEELRNYPSKRQYITLPDYNNNIVNYCWSFTKLEVRDDCFFGTSFWNTSILSLEAISCSCKRARCGFWRSTWLVQRTLPLKCKELRHLCPSPAFTTETPSTKLCPAQRRGWKIGS